MSIFEVGMLVCFGVSWPVSIIKAIKTKIVAGKSPLFMIIVIAGYLSGVLHKVFYSMDWVIVLYIVNLLMVAADLSLYMRYKSKKPAAVGNKMPVTV